MTLSGGKCIISFDGGKGGANLPDKKMGRPTDEPKPNRIDVRISDDDLQFLDKYCKDNSKTRPEAIRDGIKALRKK